MSLIHLLFLKLETLSGFIIGITHNKLKNRGKCHSVFKYDKKSNILKQYSYSDLNDMLNFLKFPHENNRKNSNSIKEDKYSEQSKNLILWLFRNNYVDCDVSYGDEGVVIYSNLKLTKKGKLLSVSQMNKLSVLMIEIRYFCKIYGLTLLSIIISIFVMMNGCNHKSSSEINIIHIK